MKLYLVRHAQSANNQLLNRTGFIEGRSSDPEITDVGHQQAELLAHHLAHPQGEPRQHPSSAGGETGFGLTHLYCSLMTRSILTADYIAERCDISAQALPDIFEKYGIFDYDEQDNRNGLPGPGRQYFEDRFPNLGLPDVIAEDGWWNRPAEDHDQFVDRIKSVINNLKQQYADSDACVAMVVHGDFIDQFVNELMGVDRHAHNYQSRWTANWIFHNTSISRFDFVNGAHNVIYLNRIDHLPAELVTW